MEGLNPELALYGSIIECTRTNTVLPQITEVSRGAVFFIEWKWWRQGSKQALPYELILYVLQCFKTKFAE